MATTAEAKKIRTSGTPTKHQKKRAADGPVRGGKMVIGHGENFVAMRPPTSSGSISWRVHPASGAARSSPRTSSLIELKLTRTPIRQALGQLAAEGLLTIIPRVGTQVRVVRPEEARAMMAMRFAIETLIVGDLARPGPTAPGPTSARSGPSRTRWRGSPSTPRGSRVPP